MKTIVGKKIGMTRVIDENGRLVAATIVEAAPNSITQIKTTEKDGYDAVQLGFGNPEKANKPQTAHAKKANADSGRYFIEVRDLHEDVKLGDSVTVGNFETGDIVNTIATSKGHGFSGTVKRHNFAMGPRSHGSRNVRRPGSIGATYPQHVFKGQKMPGRLGGARTTVKHLVVLDVLPENNLIIISGSFPGVKGSQVIISASARHLKSDK